METENKSKNLIGFVGRFTLAHVVTYVVFGIIFYNLVNYTKIFASPEMSLLMRPTSSKWVKMAPLFQFLRGALMGLGFYPFRRIILEEKGGWWKMFFFLLVFTSLCAVITGPGSTEGMLYTILPLKYHIVVMPEVAIQMLVFSVWFTAWEKKRETAVEK